MNRFPENFQIPTGTDPALSGTKSEIFPNDPRKILECSTRPKIGKIRLHVPTGYTYPQVCTCTHPVANVSGYMKPSGYTKSNVDFGGYMRRNKVGT